MRIRTVRLILAVLAAAAGAGSVHAAAPQQADKLSFFVAADMREYGGGKYSGPDYFRGAAEAMRATGPAAFLVIPGDLEPPEPVVEVIGAVFGAGFPFYPVVGNHDTDRKEYIAYLRGLNSGGTSLLHVVRKGPPGAVETMYAFEIGPVHVAVINEYYDGVSDTGSDGDVGAATYAWLAADLAAADKPYVFVVGHEPAFPLPDMTTGRMRHEKTSLNRHIADRDRFWKLLRDRKVTAYLCGHTHDASVKRIDGVWQLDCGHARGKGDPGAPSTFLRITAGGGDCRYEVYRADANGRNYTVRLAGSLLGE